MASLTEYSVQNNIERKVSFSQKFKGSNPNLIGVILRKSAFQKRLEKKV